MIHALLVILACQLFGEAASHWLALPIPGPVVGMIAIAVGALTFAAVARVTGNKDD